MFKFFNTFWFKHYFIHISFIYVVTSLYNLRIVYNAHVFLLIVYNAQQLLLIVYNEQKTCALYTMSKTTKLHIVANAQGVRKLL